LSFVFSMEEITAEISGPGLAAFHHQFAESEGDFLAILLGCFSVQNYSVNSDLATNTEKSKVRVVVQDLILASMQEVMDLKTGKLNKESLKQLTREKSEMKFVGMLKFRKTGLMELVPSFIDRKLISAVLSSCSWKVPRLYLLVGEEVTRNTLSIKYSMITFLLENNREWSRIPLVVPNLGTDQRMGYMQGIGGSSEALREIVEGSGLATSCIVDVEKNFSPLSVQFKTSFDLASDRVVELEGDRVGLEEQVLQLRLKIADKLELTSEMKFIKGLQGNLKTAIDVLLDSENKDFITVNQMELGEKEETRDENGSDDGVLNQTY